MTSTFRTFRHGRRWILGALCACALAPLAIAPASALTARERALVSEVSQFFNSYRTLKGSFTQISPRGRVSTGRFFIAKPGRMRFEYTPPHPLVIVSDGTWVAIRNNARDKVDYYPLSKTPLKMVLAERVDLMRDAQVRRVEQKDGLLVITLKANDKSVPGFLQLIYDPQQRTLRQWIVVDGQGRRTTISLSELQMDTPMNDRIFRVKRPGEGPRRRRKKTNFNAARR